MPSMGGIDFAKRIREHNKSVKILLITNFLIESNLDYHEVKQAGIDMVFEKPLHFKDLMSIIKEILGA
jgi:DNA-binding response OmpR family regulator